MRSSCWGGCPADRWAIVTSATRRLGVARWTGASLPPAAQSVTFDDVTHGKPHPEPFLAGALRLGVPAERCVVFEDSASGGDAAAAAGASVVAVGGQPWRFTPAARVRDLSHVSVVEVADRPRDARAHHRGRAVDRLEPHRDRHRHPLRRDRGLQRAAELRARRGGAALHLHRGRHLRRHDRTVGRDARAGVVGHRPRRRRAAHPRRCRCRRLRVVAHDRGAHRRVVAERLLSRPPHGPRRAGRPGARVHRLRRARRRRPRAGAARARHQHVERVQRLGRPQPLHRRARGVVPAAMGARDARAPGDRSRRPQGPAAPASARSPTSTATCTRRTGSSTATPATWGRPAGSRTTAASSSGPSGPGTRSTTRPRATSSSPPGVTDGYRLVIGAGHDEYWSAAGRDTVEAFVAGGGNYASFSGNTMFWQVRLERERHVDGVPQVLGAHERPGRRHRPGCDDRHVERPRRGAARATLPRRRLDVRAVQPVRPGHPARRAGLHRVPRRPLAARGHRPALRRRARPRRRRGRLRERRHPARVRRTQPAGRRARPVAARRRAARVGRGRGGHAGQQPRDGRVPGVDRRARRPGRPRVHRRARVRRRAAGARRRPGTATP